RFATISSKAPLRESLEKNLAYITTSRAMADFGNPSLSRPDLLREMEAVLRNYPNSEHRERVRKAVEVLNRMIPEDQTHAAEEPKNLGSLPPEEQTRELIFRLRDQYAYGYGIFDDWGGHMNTPAHRLAKLGYAAVPQLIATLDSDTLSRAYYHGGF